MYQDMCFLISTSNYLVLPFFGAGVSVANPQGWVGGGWGRKGVGEGWMGGGSRGGAGRRHGVLVDAGHGLSLISFVYFLLPAIASDDFFMPLFVGIALLSFVNVSLYILLLAFCQCVSAFLLLVLATHLEMVFWDVAHF